MKNKIFVTFLLALFVVNFVSAYETEINIKTVPGMEVQLTILDTIDKTTFSAIDKAITLSDKNGDAQIVYASDEYTFDLMVFVKDLSGEISSFSKKFRDDFIAGETINLEIFPQGKSAKDYFPEEPEVNVSEEENVTSEDTEVNRPGLTGSTVFSDGEFLSKNVPYLVGGILIIALFAGGVVLAKKGKLHLPKFLHSEGKKTSWKDESERDLIEDAEEKIKEAQEEIAKIKSRGEPSEREKKIIEAKKKLIEDQKELQKLSDEKD